MTAEADQPRAEAEASKNTADEAKLPEIGEGFRKSMRFFRDGSQKKSVEQTCPERAQGQEEREKTENKARPCWVEKTSQHGCQRREAAGRLEGSTR